MTVLNTLPLLAFAVVFPDRFTGRVQHSVGCVCVCVSAHLDNNFRTNTVQTETCASSTETELLMTLDL